MTRVLGLRRAAFASWEDASGYWTAVIVFFVFVILFMFALMIFRLCLFRSRYPNAARLVSAAFLLCCSKISRLPTYRFRRIGDSRFTGLFTLLYDDFNVFVRSKLLKTMVLSVIRVVNFRPGSGPSRSSPLCTTHRSAAADCVLDLLLHALLVSVLLSAVLGMLMDALRCFKHGNGRVKTFIFVEESSYFMDGIGDLPRVWLPEGMCRLNCLYSSYLNGHDMAQQIRCWDLEALSGSCPPLDSGTSWRFFGWSCLKVTWRMRSANI